MIKRQFEICLQSGNFRNIYFYVGFNYDLAMKSAQAELAKDCKALGFTPVTAKLISCKEVPIIPKPWGPGDKNPNRYAGS
jgi:hypothetical protein